MKTRWKILLAVVAFLGIFTGIWLLTVHVQPANDVEAYKKVLRDKGEKLEISELIPPPVPAAENAADAVEQAFQMIGSGEVEVPRAMKMVAPGKAITAWALPEARGYDFTNSWDDFVTEEAADRPMLALLGQVLVRPRLDFHLDYQKGYLMLLPQLTGFKRSAQKLTAAVVCDLHNDDTSSATTNLCILLELGRADADERTLISQLVRYAIGTITETATWDYLQDTNLTDAQLAMVQKSWERQEYVLSLEHAFGMERAVMSQSIEKARASHTDFAGFFGGFSVGSYGGVGHFLDKAKLATGEVMWRTSWSYSDELNDLKSDQIILETLRVMETNPVLKPDYDTMASQISLLRPTNTATAIFRALDIPYLDRPFSGESLARTVLKMMQMETGRRVVVTAIALKRYEIRHGHYPDALSELAPEFISAVPIDPYDGLPLKYRLNADGTFTLYSVGEDGIDDGGDAGAPLSGASATRFSASQLNWQGTHVRDWVWPQPATAAEVEKYYADEAASGK